MTRLTKLVGAAALAALLLAGAPSAAAAATDADAAQQAKDRDEIEHLAWRYTRALDTFNPDAYAAVYTPDGAFGATKGRDALWKMIDDLRKRRAESAAKGEPQIGLMHMETNHWIEFVDKDHAKYHYYWVTFFTGPKPTDPPKVAAAGNGLDEIVRLDGKWLFKNRTIVAKDD